MRLLLSSALLGLVWFTAINAAATLVAWVLGRMMIRRPGPFGAGLLLAVRLLPAVAAAVFVLAVFLPVHWRFEPADSGESFGLVLSGVAAIGLCVVLRAAWRAAWAGIAGHRLAALVRRAANLVESDAFEVRGLSGVSLTGIWRPRILIGSEARAALTPAELDLAISHEVAHRRSQDNLKRFLMFCAPDVFGWTAVARALEARWEAEAECEADAYAVMGDGDRAVVLASALVKVARLGGVARFHPLTPAWSAFHVPSLLEMRVRRLVSGAAVPPVPTGRLRWSSAIMALCLPAGVWLLELSHTLHQLTEAMVTHLP